MLTVVVAGLIAVHVVVKRTAKGRPHPRDHAGNHAMRRKAADRVKKLERWSGASSTTGAGGRPTSRNTRLCARRLTPNSTKATDS